MCAAYIVKQWQQHVLISAPTAASYTVQQFFIEKYRFSSYVQGPEFVGPETGFPSIPLNIHRTRNCSKCMYHLMEPVFHTGRYITYS
jgi:hypothetical protein